MLSRVANSIYWLARYVERAENVARAIDVNLQLQLDLPGEDRLWEPVIQTAGNADLFFKTYSAITVENSLKFLTLDMNNPSSIISSIAAARENARCVQEIISSELWMHINTFYLSLQSEDTAQKMVDDPHSFYTKVKEFGQLTTGIMYGTMSHDQSWNFARMGRLLERADQTSRILDVKYFILLPNPDLVGLVLDTVQWTALLKSVSGFEMFRKRYSSVTPRNVSEFLLLNSDFPRSLAYCVKIVEQSLKDITYPERTNSLSLRKIGKLNADLEFTTIDEVIGKGLHEVIEEYQVQLGELHNAIVQDFGF